MDQIIQGMQNNPILFVIVIVAIVGALLSIGPMLKAKKLGKSPAISVAMLEA